MLERAVMQRGAGNGWPAVELPVRPVIPLFQSFRLEVRWAIHHMPGVVEIPVSRQNSAFAGQASMQLCTGIGRLNMKSRCCDPVVNGPIRRVPEYVVTVVIHAKDKAAVDHDAERVQAVSHRFVVATKILPL